MWKRHPIAADTSTRWVPIFHLRKRLSRKKRRNVISSPVFRDLQHSSVRTCALATLCITTLSARVGEVFSIKALFILRRLAVVTETIINALVFSKLYYCSSVWSSTSACNSCKLRYVQNFAMHIICNIKEYDRISPLFRNLCWLPVKTQVCCWDATLTFKCKTGQASEYLTSMYITRSSVYRRITRNFQRLNIPLFKTATGQKTFYYKSVSIWNKLDPSHKIM